MTKIEWFLMLAILGIFTLVQIGPDWLVKLVGVSV